MSKFAYGIFNGLSIIVLDVQYDIDDYVVAKFSNEKRTFKSVIVYEDDEPYFMACDIKVPLNECMRID